LPNPFKRILRAHVQPGERFEILADKGAACKIPLSFAGVCLTHALYFQPEPLNSGQKARPILPFGRAVTPGKSADEFGGVEFVRPLAAARDDTRKPERSISDRAS